MSVLERVDFRDLARRMLEAGEEKYDEVLIAEIGELPSPKNYDEIRTFWNSLMEASAQFPELKQWLSDDALFKNFFSTESEVGE